MVFRLKVIIKIYNYDGDYKGVVMLYVGWHMNRPRYSVWHTPINNLGGYECLGHIGLFKTNKSKLWLLMPRQVQLLWYGTFRINRSFHKDGFEFSAPFSAKKL